MRNKIILIWLTIGLFAAALCGCGAAARRNLKADAAKVEGRILNRVRLAQGGNFLIVPFSAGENVFATEELQSIALRIVRGINEELQVKPQLVLLVADSDSVPDLVMKGRVTRMLEAKRFPSFFAPQFLRVLAVEGEIMDKKTGEPLARFSHSVQNDFPQESFGTMAGRLGRDIGRFIAVGIE